MVKTPEGSEAIQTNDSGMSFSIGLAEYSVALYMKTVLQESDTAKSSEVTIVAPNTL